MYDYLIVGAGLFGAVFAEQAMSRGKKVLVIDRREHIAGNCYTEQRHGIEAHVYGPHIFHTNSDKIWNYARQFGRVPILRHASSCGQRACSCCWRCDVICKE
jgi:UDP-galactopyranose mutase